MNIDNIILRPQVCGEIVSIGNWDGNGDIRDIYHDVANAAGLLKSNPHHLLMNFKTRYYMHAMTCEREPFYKDIIIHLFDVRPSEVMAVKDYIMQISESVPENIALLVSNSNEVVIIHTNGKNKY